MVSILVAAAVFAANQAGTTPPEDALANAQGELSAARQAYIDSRKSRSGLKEAALHYGEVAVNSPALMPGEKYPLSLALFRQVLEMDPDNETAREWENTILTIYKSLGREPATYDLGSIR